MFSCCRLWRQGQKKRTFTPGQTVDIWLCVRSDSCKVEFQLFLQLCNNNWILKVESVTCDSVFLIQVEEEEHTSLLRS